MKKLLLISFLASTSLYSCKISTSTEVNPDNASAISGNYQMKTYRTHIGSSTPNSADKLVVSRVDNNNVKVVIDYYNNAAGPDVILSKMAITKSGNDYKLSQSFPNGTGNATISGNTINFTVAYTNGNYANITGIK